MQQVKAQTQRLDKILVHLGVGSRTEVQKLIRQGRVFVGVEPARDAAERMIAEGLEIRVDDRILIYREFSYFMLNKPAGLISASRGEDIVVDLLAEEDRRPGLFPIGRLDRDTEGLLVISNDGQLSHRLLAPKQHVPKRYRVRFEGRLDADDVAAFQKGIVLDDGEVCLPAQLLLPTEAITDGEVEVILHEGKFHQVKRMMQAVECTVIALKRVAFGPLLLDESLEPGEYRDLTEVEVESLREAVR